MAPAIKYFMTLLVILIVAQHAAAQSFTQTITVATTTLAGIQAAIDLVSSSRALAIVPARDYDFGTGFLRFNEWGVTLRGAGQGLTVFKSSDTIDDPSNSFSCLTAGEGRPMLVMCYPNDMPNPPSPFVVPSVIEGITFKNTNLNPLTAGPQKAISLFANGPSPLNPSIIRDCEFKNFGRSPGVGVELASGRASNWQVLNSRFNGTRQGVFINNNNHVRVSDNYFTRFEIAGIRQSAGDQSIGLAITGNTFVGGVTTETFRPTAIALSGNAASDSTFRNWLIANNDISGVTEGFEFRYSSAPNPSASFVGVEISQNSVVADYRCNPTTNPCFNVLNFAPAPLNVANNWWGTASPPASLFFPNTGPLAVVFQPAITSFVQVPCPTTGTAAATGFCVSSITISTDQVPVITSIKTEPSQVAQGDTFQVVVTLQAPLTFGFVSVVSTPAGISCPESPKSIAFLPIVRVTCVAPVLSTVQTAAQQQSGEPAVVQSSTDDAQKALAAAQLEVADMAALASPQEAEHVAQPQAQVAAIPTRPTTTYTSTATVTADRTASSSTTVQVCQNLPWPFRAVAGDCDGCTYDCSSGTFSCKSCNCQCDFEGPSYDSSSSRPYSVPGSDPDAHVEASGAGMQSHRGFYTCEGPKSCICSPAALTIGQNCDGIMYDACNNKLKCFRISGRRYQV